VRAYYYLFKTRFEEGLLLDIYVQAEDLKMYIPPLTMQILLENAVKHNEISAAIPLHIVIISSKGMLEISNNMQRKAQSLKSTQKGLATIFAKYRLLHATVT
jgi:LytS/YehU family sensor histidine kinase